MTYLFVPNFILLVFKEVGDELLEWGKSHIT